MTHTTQKVFALLIAAPLMMAGAFATAGHHGDKAGAKDIVDTAVSAGQFNTLAAALDAAGLVETLKGDGPFTVFAPTDDAFANLPDGALEALLDDPEALAEILKFHVVPGALTLEELKDCDYLTTLQGDRLVVRHFFGRVFVNGVKIRAPDIFASNGVIHGIGRVLIPKSAMH